MQNGLTEMQKISVEFEMNFYFSLLNIRFNIPLLANPD